MHQSPELIVAIPLLTPPPPPPPPQSRVAISRCCSPPSRDPVTGGTDTLAVVATAQMGAIDPLSGTTHACYPRAVVVLEVISRKGVRVSRRHFAACIQGDPSRQVISAVHDRSASHTPPPCAPSSPVQSRSTVVAQVCSALEWHCHYPLVE